MTMHPLRWILAVAIVHACGGRANTSPDLEAGAPPPRAAVDAAWSDAVSPDIVPTADQASPPEPDVEADANTDDGSWVGPARTIVVGWSDAVVDRCRRCTPDEATSASCVTEDGLLVMSPFSMICLTQLATSDATVRTYNAARADVEAFAITAWANDGCANVAAPPALPPTPAVARRCFTRSFTCPEGRQATACDGVRECSTGEDEGFCGVVAPVFVCHHGENLAWSRVCDGIADCELGDDERNCFARL